jgi:membrane-bound lytic murein transglycosylase F
MSQWQMMKARGYLSWVTRPSPLTYYTGLDGIIGLEYDILKNFCDNNDIELEVISTNSNRDLFKMLNENSVDIAGANLAKTATRLANYQSSIEYDETFVSLVSSLAKTKIKSLKALSDLKGAVLANSSYVSIAKQLTKSHGLQIDVVDNSSLYEILQQVTGNSIDYTFADSNIISIYQAYIPHLRTGMKLSDNSGLVFFMPHSQYGVDDSLRDRLNDFIEQYIAEDKVEKYKQQIIESLPNSKPADTVNFLKNYHKRWPIVKPLIYATAEKFAIDPILLGAISYQESHWNANAISPTLVKGLMMLTKAVASEQNVSDRLDPLQSLEGGSQYFLKMKGKIPQRIRDPDRTYFALAAYNIGFGHLEKARVITQRAGKNPDLWRDVREYLPELNKIEELKADGKTAVRYVENIHVYQNLLQWKEQQLYSF